MGVTEMKTFSVSLSASVLATGLLAFAFAGATPTTAYAAECKNPESLGFAIISTEETVAEFELY